MTTYLWVMFILYCIQVIVYSWRLGSGDYPRKRYYDPSDDVFTLLITLGMGGWVAVLLFF